MKFIRKLLHKFGVHWWEYRNPSCRTCKICNKHQDEMVMAYEDEPLMKSKGVWEDQA